MARDGRSSIIYVPLLSRDPATGEPLDYARFSQGGTHPRVLDCSFFAHLDFAAQRFDYRLPERWPRLQGWYERFRQRASAKAA